MSDTAKKWAALAAGFRVAVVGLALRVAGESGGPDTPLLLAGIALIIWGLWKNPDRGDGEAP